MEAVAFVNPMVTILVPMYSTRSGAPPQERLDSGYD
jgi:hypothetical protein